MKLVRLLNLPVHRKRFHDGPCPGGTFWCLKGKNDLILHWEEEAGLTVEADLEHVLRIARVWVQDVLKPGTWEEVHSVDQLPRFRAVWRHGWEGSDLIVTPFMPEFYIVPKPTQKGKRFARKARGPVPTQEGSG